MNVLFVYSVDDIESPGKPLRTSEEMQFGISYISAVLKKHGHRTRLVVLSRLLGEDNYRRLDSYIDTFKPALICFTAVTSEYSFITNQAQHVKRRFPGIFLLAGGAHVSLNPDGVLEEGFDGLCVGEGEYPVLELVTRLESRAGVSGIPNISTKQTASVESNPPRPFLQDLDNLPFPDREMWREWISSSDDSGCAILLGRGCPFECTYCCNHALRKLTDGKYVRLRSQEKIIEEIESVIKDSPHKRNFYLEVETIGANNEWALDLCARLEELNSKSEGRLSFSTNLRVLPGAKLERLFQAFAKSNFKHIKIGVESGSEKVRRQVLNRNYSNEDIIETVRLARRYGMQISFYNLLGVPGETFEDFKETIELNRRCQPDRAFAHIFFPYPGTKLYKKCEGEGLLREYSESSLERCKATLDLPGFSRRQIQDSFIWFDYDVYKDHRPIHKIMAKVLVSKCRSDENLHKIYRRMTYSPVFNWFKKSLRQCV